MGTLQAVWCAHSADREERFFFGESILAFLCSRLCAMRDVWRSARLTESETRVFVDL